MNEKVTIERCGAKTRGGKPCKKFPINGRNRCRLHGGKTLVGAASPQYKTGQHSRYAKFLPERLKESFQRSLENDDILVLNPEIALIDSLLEERITNFDSGESGELWERLGKAWQDMRIAARVSDKKKQAILMSQIGGLIEQGVSDHLSRQEAVDLVDKRRRLVESERRRLVEAREMVALDMVMVMLNAVFSGMITAVRKYADEPTAKQIITQASAEYSKATGF